MDGWMDGRADVRTEFLPILQDFVPCRGRCPATLCDFTTSKKQGKGTADLMMPFGVLFFLSPTHTLSLSLTLSHTLSLQTRNVTCQVLRGEKLAELPAVHCNETEMPELSQPCNRRLCVFKWTTGDWTDCSVTCGIGKDECRRASTLT